MRGLSQNKAIWRRFATWDNKTLVLRTKVCERARKRAKNGNDGVILEINPPPRGFYRGELVIRVVSESDEPPRGASEGLPEGRNMAFPAQ